jgi:excisionase family DNA binding protein
MHRHLQFGIRENPASDRRHGSRALQSLSPNPNSAVTNHAMSRASGETSSEADTDQQGFATGGEVAENLLTVKEVAATLKVPCSWVYERTRRRGHDCLPHIKLGKYLRFRSSDLIAFLNRQSMKQGG